MKQRPNNLNKPPRGGPWKKGQSGNPNGRPRDVGWLKDLCRQHTQEAILRLVDLMRHADKDTVSCSAAEILLSYGWGKPTQMIEMPDGTTGAAVVILPARVEGEAGAVIRYGGNGDKELSENGHHKRAGD